MLEFLSNHPGYVGLTVGLFVGAFAGILAMGFMNAARGYDDEYCRGCPYLPKEEIRL